MRSSRSPFFTRGARVGPVSQKILYWLIIWKLVCVLIVMDYEWSRSWNFLNKLIRGFLLSIFRSEAIFGHPIVFPAIFEYFSLAQPSDRWWFTNFCQYLLGDHLYPPSTRQLLSYTTTKKKKSLISIEYCRFTPSPWNTHICLYDTATKTIDIKRITQYF